MRTVAAMFVVVLVAVALQSGGVSAGTVDNPESCHVERSGDEALTDSTVRVVLCPNDGQGSWTDSTVFVPSDGVADAAGSDVTSGFSVVRPDWSTLRVGVQ